MATVVDAQRRAERAAEQRRRDEATVERLDEIRALAGETWNWKATSAAYADAFNAHFGADVAALGVDEAARRISASGVRERLVLALTFWTRASEVAGEQLTTLPKLLTLVDADPWRVKLRRANADLEALRAIAAQADLDALAGQDVIRLADSLGEAGDPEQAAKLAFEAWRRHPGDFWACYVCAQWNRRCAPPRVDETIRFFTAALAIRPRSASAASGLGLALYLKGDLRGAIATHREAIRIDPKFVFAHDNLGVELAESGELDGAIAEHREAIRLDPTYASAHDNLGNVLLRKGDRDGAIAEYREAIRLDPKDAMARYNLGNGLRSKGDRAGAIAEYREAIRLDPKFANAYGNLGLELYRNGDLDGAIREYREAIRLDPTVASAHGNLGAALYDKGDLDGAIPEIREAIRLDPKNAGKHSDLGAALCDKGDLDGAMSELREAIRLGLNDADTHNNLGNVLNDKGDFDGAIAEYREAIRREATFAEAHRNLATALRNRGQLRESLEAFRRAHELGSRQKRWPFPTAQEVQYAERLVAASDRLAAFAQGKADPSSPLDALDMGQAGYYEKSYVSSAMAWARAFEMEPQRADDLKAGHRYNAACAAALASSGKGTDAATLDAAGRTRWRRQAIDWLRANLDAWKKAGDAKTARSTLEHWKQDTDLAGLRDEVELAKLPAEDRAACEAVWRDVDAAIAERTSHK